MKKIIALCAFVYISLEASAQIAGVSCCDWMMLKRQKMGAITLSKDIKADGLEMDMGPLGKRVLFENKLRTEPETAMKMKHTADSLGINVSSIAMSGFFAQNFITRENYKDLVQDCLNAMALFGAKVAFLPLGGSEHQWEMENSRDNKELVRRLHEVGEMAKAAGVVIGVRTAMQAEWNIRFLKAVNSDGIKIYYNFQDACDNGWDYCRELELMGADRIAQIHISNTDAVTLRNDKEIDMPKVKATLEKIGYKGWLTVERSRNAKEVRNVRGNYGDNVAYLHEVFK